jgi:hypothetical protein
MRMRVLLRFTQIKVLLQCWLLCVKVPEFADDLSVSSLTPYPFPTQVFVEREGRSQSDCLEFLIESQIVSVIACGVEMRSRSFS